MMIIIIRRRKKGTIKLYGNYVLTKQKWSPVAVGIKFIQLMWDPHFCTLGCSTPVKASAGTVSRNKPASRLRLEHLLEQKRARVASVTRK